MHTAKYGRVLSRANETEINHALTALVNVLRRAGMDIELTHKAIDPATAQGLVEAFTRLHESLASTGIEAAAQGQPEKGKREDRFAFEGYEIEDGEAAKFDPSQERDDQGEWTDSGGSSGAEDKPKKKPKKPKKPDPEEEETSEEDEDERNYRDFGALDEATVAENYQKNAPTPTDEQAESLEYYRDDEGNYALNSAFRSGEALSEEDTARARELDTILSDATLEHDTVLHRGISPNNPQLEVLRQQIESGDLGPGSVIRDNGYASTSMSADVANGTFAEGGGALFRINAPQGSNGLYMNTAMDLHGGGVGSYQSEFRDEREVLLPRGSRFRVTSIEHTGNQYLIDVTLEGYEAVAARGRRMAEITKRLEMQLKQLDPETAQAIIDAFNGFATELTELGIVEAAQGQDPNAEEQPPTEEEKPVDEDGNPVEEDPDEEAPAEDAQRRPAEEEDPNAPPKKKPPVKSKGWLEQSEVNYTPDFPGSDHCASCLFFVSANDFGRADCRLIATWPQDILATGHCDRHEPAPVYEPTPMEVVVVAEAAIAEKPSLKARVQAMFARTPAPEGNFQIFKGADGQHYWLARHTNMFEDRDKEILSSSAHQRYIKRVDMGLVDKPELWMWHTKGSRHGQADYVWEHAGFVFALGHFDDTPEGKRAVKFYQKQAGKLELSHGFTYPTWALKDGVYETYNTFEISVLPQGMAANPYTTFEEIQVMGLSDKTRAFIAEGLGQDVVERIERAQTAAEKDADTLMAEDKRYKDFANVVNEKDGEVSVDVKQVLKVVAELIDAQGDIDARLEKAVADATTAKAAYESKTKELEAVMADLKVRQTMTPKMTSRMKQTELGEDNALAKALELVKETETYVHPVFGTMKREG